jgi:hypothetical protein
VSSYFDRRIPSSATASQGAPIGLSGLEFTQLQALHHLHDCLVQQSWHTVPRRHAYDSSIEMVDLGSAALLHILKQ